MPVDKDILADVDAALGMLLGVRKYPPGTEVRVPEDLVIKIVRAAREVFMSQLADQVASKIKTPRDA